MVAGKDTGTNWKEAGYVEKRRTLSRNGCSYNARGSTAAISGSNLKLLCSGRAPSVLHVGRHCELLGLIGGELELNQLALAVLRCTRAKPKGRVDMRVTGSGWSQRLSISIKDGGNDKCHASCKADKAHEHRCTRRRRPRPGYQSSGISLLLQGAGPESFVQQVGGPVCHTGHRD